MRAAALLLLLALLRSDAESAVAGSRWRLAAAQPDAILRELGNFSSQLQVIRQVGADSYLLMDPAGAVVARFAPDTDAKRIAARIRILLTGRFDPELAETCTPQTAVSEVRDRWQKGL